MSDEKGVIEKVKDAAHGVKELFKGGYEAASGEKFDPVDHHEHASFENEIKEPMYADNETGEYVSADGHHMNLKKSPSPVTVGNLLPM